MPIRMVDDDPNEFRDRENPQPQRDRDTGGGGGGGIGMIGMLLPLLFKYPKLLLLGIVAALAYFFLFSGGGGGTGDEFSQGCEMKQEIFDKAEVFEPLSARSGLPAAVSLEKYCPKRLNQGAQGSCVGWAATYAARTILQSASTGVAPDATVFSPAYTYNQIHLENCQGSYMNDALNLMMQQGSVPFNDFKYDERTCDRAPSPTVQSKAATFKMKGYNRLTEDAGDYGINVQAIKQNLAQGSPVVIGMMVTESFEYSRGDVWEPSGWGDRSLGGHAMCVVGYDDNKHGGAFRLMNSWGSDWGDRGFLWVRYKDFKATVKEAYGLYPLPRKSTDASTLQASVGLIENQSQGYIPLKALGGNLFGSATISKGTKFKIEVNNSIECYTYVFGQETDGSSYVLFPYTNKHSPYCGITGSRVFPKSQSLQADQVGTKDLMAIVVSKKELDYTALNAKINQSKGNYRDRVNAAIATEAVALPAFKAGENVSFSADVKTKNALAIVLEINKN